MLERLTQQYISGYLTQLSEQGSNGLFRSSLPNEAFCSALDRFKYHIKKLRVAVSAAATAGSLSSWDWSRKKQRMVTDGTGGGTWFGRGGVDPEDEGT